MKMVLYKNNSIVFSWKFNSREEKMEGYLEMLAVVHNEILGDETECELADYTRYGKAASQIIDWFIFNDEGTHFENYVVWIEKD